MDIKLANGTNIFLQYEQFNVASAKDKYKLTVEEFQRTMHLPIQWHIVMKCTLLLMIVIMINGAVLTVH